MRTSIRYLLIVSAVFLRSCGGAVLRGGAKASSSSKNTGPPQLQDLISQSHHRHLLGSGDGFTPLACNDGIDSVTCEPLSSLTVDPIDPLVIPCGTCYQVNEEGTIEIPGGLNIDGKLSFPDGSSVTIKTPHVFVQGVLEISDTATVQPDNKAVTFVLTGTDDQILTTHADQTGTSACASGCNFGKKAFVVAGGQADVDAYPESCPTWTTIQSATDTSSPTVPPEEYEVAKSPRPGCTHELFRHIFSTASGALDWTGYLGANVDIDDDKGALVISGRKRVWQGAFYDLVDVRDCLVGDGDYLLQAQMMLSHRDGRTGPTACKANETNCLNMNVRTRFDDETDRWQTPFRQFDWAGSDYDEWFTVGGVVRFDTDEANETAVLYTYIDIDNFEAEADLYIKDFSLTLANSASYLDSSNVCGSLAPNGDAEANGFNTFPFTIDHHKAELIVKEETLQDGSRNRYFHAYGRRYGHNGLRFSVPPSCMTAQSVYNFSTKLRIHTTEKQTPKVHYICKLADGNYHYPFVTQCPSMNYDDGWTTCSGSFTVEADFADCVWYQFYYWMADAEAEMDYDDISLTRAEGGIESVVVKDEVSTCWGPGAEVVITSHTVNHDDDQVRQVVSVADNGDGTTTLALNDTVKKPTTTAKYATEIGLLDRNVDIVGDDDGDGNGVHGGHFMIANTPGVVQKVEGVGFRNMGQQGNNHRFPIHVHNCHNADGMSIARNAIVGSHQRCVNILGSHNVTVKKNVAYNTKGHCFTVQDGVEVDNEFLHNLGSRTLAVDTRFSNAESDHTPATFWFTHPQNIVKGNVAAGSRYYGFRYELGANTRTAESTATFGDVDARTVDLGEFHNNVAHSNVFHGLLTQHRPSNERAVFYKFSSYKNGGSGIKVDLAVNLAVTHGVFADNRKAVELRRSDDVLLKGLTVEGQTPEYDIVKSKGDTRHDHCPSSTDPIVGVLLHTYQYNDGNPGITVEDSSFTHFDNTEGCPNSAAFSFETQDNNDLHWSNDPTTLQNVQVTDSRGSTAFLNMCVAQAVGVKDVFMTDLDSSLNPDDASSFAGVSSIVIDEERLTTFGNSGCTNYADACFAYCENMCLRLVEFFTEPSISADYSLRVSDGNGKEILVPGDQHVPSTFIGTSFRNYRVFGVPLPPGSYTAEFVDEGGNSVWSPFVREIWNEANPGCSDGTGLQVGDVTLTIPSVTNDSPVCANLLKNGDAEDGTVVPWRHNNGGITYIADAGINGSGAIGTLNRNSAYHAIGQFLDMRCLALNKHKFYEVKVFFKLTDGFGGAEVTCDPNTNNLDTDCPDVFLEYYTYSDQALKSNSFNRKAQHPIAETIFPFKANEWNMMHGLLFVSEEMATIANDLFLYMTKFNKNHEIIVDDSSISLLNETCDEMILNGDFGAGDSRYWKAVEYRRGAMSMVPGAGGGNDLALKTTGRTRNYHGPTARFSGGCLIEGNRYVLRAKYKLEDDNGNLVTCDTSYSGDDGLPRCPEVLLKTYAPPDCTDCSSEYRTIGYPASPVSSTGFSELAWTFTATAKMAVGIRHHLYFNALNIAHNLVVDDVSLVPYKGTGQDCSNLIYNPDFEGGTGEMWINERGSNSRLTAFSPGAEGSNFALRNTARSADHNGFETVLDERCLVTDEVWDVTAQFRLLKFTDGTGVTCDTSTTHGSNRCPHVRLWADSCSDPTYAGGAGVWVYNSLGNGWNPDGWNAFSASFTVPAAFSSCGRVRVLVRDLDASKDIVMDNINIKPHV